MSRDYSSGQLVGIDLHRRRSVICRMTAEGEVLESVRIENDRAALLREVGRAGAGVPAAIEATYGWYWAVDALQDNGSRCTWRTPRAWPAARATGSRPTGPMPVSWWTCCGLAGSPEA